MGSKSNSRPTKGRTLNDNSAAFEAKVAIRRHAVADIAAPRVLDAFRGHGWTWAAVQRLDPSKPITVTGIDTRNDKTEAYLKGDSAKWLAQLDLARFDVVDLDAYGQPVAQVDILARRGYRGRIVCTFILARKPILHLQILERIGIPRDMAMTCKTLFATDPEAKILGWLHSYGVRAVEIAESEGKLLFWCSLDPANGPKPKPRP